MKKIFCLLLFPVFTGSVNAQSFFTSVKTYKYSNDTVYAEIVSSIRSFSDVCYKIEILGTEMTGSGTSKSLKLYYHSPNSTGGGIPMDCVVTDTIKIAPITGSVKSIDLHLYTVVPVAPNIGDTTNENSSAIFFLPLDVIQPGSYEDDILVYPNPADNAVYIKNIKAGTKIEIFNIAGTRIYSGVESSTQGKVSVSSLIPGIYFIRFVEVSGKHRMIKILKE